MAKLVHWHHTLRPGGGPSGYLYNLKSAMTGDEGFVVACDSETDCRTLHAGGGTGSRSWDSGWRRVLKRLVNPVRLFVLLCGRNPGQFVNLLKVATRGDVIVFHSMAAAYDFMRSAESRYYRIGVMCHSPVDAAQEWYDLAKDSVMFSWMLFPGLFLLRRRQDYVMRRCHAIVGPAPESYAGHRIALTPAEFKAKFYPVMSGVAAPQTTCTRDEARRRLGVGDNRQLILYLGRYIAHKGYDIYCGLSERANAEGLNMQFISAGTGPMQHLAAPAGVRDLGWVSGVGDLLIAADVLVVPNRVAYFDLVILEALALGCPVITTGAGGGSVVAKMSSGAVLSLGGGVNEIFYALLSFVLQHAPRRAAVVSVHGRCFSLTSFVYSHNALAAMLGGGR